MDQRCELYSRTDSLFYDAPPAGSPQIPDIPEIPSYQVRAVVHASVRGRVLLAAEPGTGDVVVLKETWPSSGRGDGTHCRAERERAALVRLAGLGVAPALRGDVTAGGHRFLVLERVPGETLSEVLRSRHPLRRADGGDVAEHVAWVMETCAAVEDAVTMIHENGLVHGGLTPGDVVIRPDGGVALIDFERAAPLGDATRTGPGPVVPAGLTGLDADRYALARLRFALLLPVAELFLLDPGKAPELADVANRLFAAPASFLRPAARIIGRGERGKAPAAGGWGQLRAAMAGAVLASATPERDDRLFPGDPAQFDGPWGGLGFAHGAAGVLYALHVTGAGRFPEHERWLIDRARRLAADAPLGFYDGLHGVIHALARLGRCEEALELWEGAAGRPWQGLGADLFRGLAGVGLNHIFLGDLSRALEAGALAAERLDVRAGEAGDDAPAGLMHGSTGPALLFLRLFERTGDVRWLDEAERALRQDLRRCAPQPDGSLQVVAGRRAVPHLGGGAVGVAWVLGDLLQYRCDPELAAARARLDLAARAPFHRHAGVFAGRAGIIAYLCRERAGGWGREDPEAARQLAALSWHALGYRGHLAYPGDGLLRLSMDLATGTAGVLLAAGAALHGEPVGLPFLGGAMPTGPGGRAGRDAPSAVEV
ncbi:protein kinase/lanthionine synthetase C family protein [Microbispora sp. RL4-1S]|uniref:Protein kinase/lanthionine synthetase C family protein n=1 Tax=Microbispora oryzae TaxID=2806554 RepID=A0A940WW05_9ACTN|nr:protein kinase/lanthionine synthetase C family protein [Microbispora oryzae]MBP2708306.1 protein kinase/lanthionine synthetase C family protein [Microbispora oryzae]